mmetsp:Transcript_60525/g.119946  ORF Transcript_60525/g.119946 Transcript_60525/m.119946 type:complete len:126 (+) Transcript_60525:1029-1406(+)
MTPWSWERPNSRRRKSRSHAVERSVNADAEATVTIFFVRCCQIDCIDVSACAAVSSAVTALMSPPWRAAFFASTAIVAARDCQRRRGCAKRPASSLAVRTAFVAQEPERNCDKAFIHVVLWLHAR